MKIRYTVQYWYQDEHDFLAEEFNTLREAIEFASQIDKGKYKDISIYGRHYQRINEPFEHNGTYYADWEWQLINDDFFVIYDEKGIKLNDHSNIT